MIATMKTDLSEFKFREVAERSGATHSQIMWWSRMKWVVAPRRSSEKGKWSKRQYTYDNLVRIALLKVLLDAGIPAETASSVINVAKKLIGKMSLGFDFFDPPDWGVFCSKNYFLNIADGGDLVYLSWTDPKTDREERSMQFGPLSWVKDKVALNRDGFAGELQANLLMKKDMIPYTQFRFITRINLTNAVRRLRGALP